MSKPVAKSSMKRLYEGLGVDNYPANSKRPKVYGVRTFPKNCGYVAINKTDSISPEPNATNPSKLHFGDSLPNFTDQKLGTCGIEKSPFNIKYPNIDVKLDTCGGLRISNSLVSITVSRRKDANEVSLEDDALNSESESIESLLDYAKELLNSAEKRLFTSTKIQEALFSEKNTGNKLYAETEKNLPTLEETEEREISSEQSNAECIESIDNWIANNSDCEVIDIESSMIDLKMGKSIDVGESPCNGGKKSNQYMKLVNLECSVHHDHSQAIKVRKALVAFEDYYMKLLSNFTAKCKSSANLEAAKRLKEEGMWIKADKPFGHIPGVEIGDTFHFRTQLVVIGLHSQHFSGIDYKVINGKVYATSVVDSGRYENESKTQEILIYSGQGGNGKISENQKLKKGNLALVNSMEMRLPVRVTLKNKSCGKVREYTYDGLYVVEDYWEERDSKSLQMVFKFEMRRMPGQPITRQSICNTKKLINRENVCVVDDISGGKEKVKIHAINGVDDERPPLFTYTTKIVYPNWFHPIVPIGCNCINGCSDSTRCHCISKNGGGIPFNEKGSILRTMPLVHECGPQCKCPPTCMNRVSQNGIRYQLELFKTKSKGWGVRSRDYIPSGGFICEYTGELLHDKEADQRVESDEYLFDITVNEDEEPGGGFAIDAANSGSVGRFINHSCYPNVYTQEVLYDHEDERIPHIMFFATRAIRPLQELSYDYGYKNVTDANGNIRMKDCSCGARVCRGRMY